MSISRIYQDALISSSYVQILSETISKWNISPDQLFWGTGVEVEKFNDLNYRINLLSFKKVINRAIQLTSEPGISFYAGAQLKISSHGLLGLTAAIAPSAREAIETINQFVSLQCSFVQFDFSTIQNTAYHSVSYDPAILNLKDPIDRQAYEFSCIFFLTGFVHLVRFFIPEFKPSLDLQCKQPSYFYRFTDILSSTFEKIRYEQAQTQLIIAVDVLDSTLNMADPLTSEKLKRLCQKELAQLHAYQDILYKVKKSIDDPNNGLQGIEQVAQQLNLTKRTLQRILQQRNINFHSLYEEVRQKKAQKLLQENALSRMEMANKLGYSSVSSFHRACKRWGIL